MDYETFAWNVYSACQVSSRTWVVHPKFRHQNFYSQQLRCLALIREMFRERDIVANKTHVAVVGSGVSGLTLAAAALTGGALVKLISKGKPLSLYKSADHRELHPNVIAWPFQEPRAITNLPFLNWACGPAPTVVDQILEQWNEDFSAHVHHIDAGVTKLVEGTDGVTVLFEDGNSTLTDIVVVACGFKREIGVGDFATQPYWFRRDFDPGHVAVSGSGDGALIDAAYQVFGEKAVAACRALAYILKDKPHKEAIEAAEREALQAVEAGDPDRAFEILKGFYSKLGLSAGDLNSLEKYKREITNKTTIYHRDKTPFASYAAPINKVMASALMGAPFRALGARQGVLEQDSVTKALTAATPTGAKIPVDRDRLIVRHGASSASIDILSDAQKMALAGADPRDLAPMAVDAYDAIFYRDRPKRKIGANRKKKTKRYLIRTAKYVKKMAEYVAGDERTVSLDFADGRNWNLWTNPRPPDDLRIMFPIVGDGFSIRLSESPRLANVRRGV